MAFAIVTLGNIICPEPGQIFVYVIRCNLINIFIPLIFKPFIE